MAIQSAAIIHGGPASCHHQVVSVSGLPLSRTHVPYVYELLCGGLETRRNFRETAALTAARTKHSVVSGNQAKLANLKMDFEHLGSWWHAVIPHIQSSDLESSGGQEFI